MRSDSCGECGDEFVWDADAASAVCPSCGVLQDAAQVVLDAHIEPEDNTRDRYALPFFSRSTLKGYRNQGWYLPGQGRAAAVERNKIAMREYISTLAGRIGHPSLFTRSLFVFEQTMEQGHFKYGRKARLLAGASLTIALREAHKGETIRDIAYLIDEPSTSLTRVFITVVELLGLKLPSTEPSWTLPILRKRVSQLIESAENPLPKELLNIIKDIDLVQAMRTALLLSELITRSGDVSNLPSPPTACAIFILALEGEALRSLPHCGDLATFLGKCVGSSQAVVMRRYKIIYDLVEEWSREVPWLEDVQSKGGKKGTRKTARRMSIAKCLKDTVRYHTSSWKTNLESTGPLNAPELDSESVSSSEISSNGDVDRRDIDASTSMQDKRPSKRRKKNHIDSASGFLLSPLQADTAQFSSISRSHSPSSVDIASHLLSAAAIPSDRKDPTRLQLLASMKNIDDITDDELFDDGELENLLRPPEEQDILRRTCDWAQQQNTASPRSTSRRDTMVRRGSASEPRSKSRVDMDVLNRILNGDVLDASGSPNGTDVEDYWSLQGVLDYIEPEEID